jgi:hypothetical protein
MIDDSALPEATKMPLKTAVESARNNPALVKGVLDQVRSALGM